MVCESRDHHKVDRPRLISIAFGDELYGVGKVVAPKDHDIIWIGENHTLPDADAALAVYFDDPAGDIVWFAAHPHAETRVRSIAATEAKVLGLSMHATVTVTMTPLGLNRRFRDRRTAAK